MFGKSWNLNILNSDGHTPLSVAVQNQNVDMVKYLLDHGVDINAKNYIENRYVWTALHIAVEINDANMVQFLLDYENCDIVAKTESNLTPLYIATYSNNLAIIKKLLRKIAQHNVYSRNIIDHVLPSFHEAVNRNKILIAKYYLDTVKIDVNLKTEIGLSPLEIAAKFQNFEIFKLLVDHGAVIKYSLKDRYESGFDGDSLLYYAVKKADVKMVDLILTRGVQINARNKKANGVTILHLAIHSGNKDIVEKLIKCGANVNSKCGIDDFEEITPLLYAVFRKSYKIVLLLLKTEANLNDVAKINSKTKSIIDIVIEEKYNYIFLMTILNLGADINKSSIHNRKLVIRISNVLEQHLIRLKAAELFIHKKFNSWVALGMKNRKFYDRCRREVEKLKLKLISDSTFCYHDLLIKNTTQVAMLANNKNIEKALKFNELKAEFPVYAEILFCHFRRGQRRNQLLKKTEKILDCIFINLPRVCVPKILAYFNDEDLL
ncbi:putative ankyrin repeat protein RF_0381 isoform X2 [Microplitis mediator]|nr:putative ankyrin repeat protein RF_0381 isoform X2 [Microplitis mediator]